MDAPNGNYHLLAGSPAIDSGTDSGPPLPLFDVDGNERTFDGDGDGSPVVDLGAAEFVGGGGCGGG